MAYGHSLAHDAAPLSASAIDAIFGLCAQRTQRSPRRPERYFWPFWQRVGINECPLLQNTIRHD